MSACWIRNLYGVEQEAEWAGDEGHKQDHDPFMVRVPGFGVCMVGQARADGEPILRAGQPQWMALVVAPRANGTYGPGSRRTPRDVRVADDGRLEVELLPNSSNEDRIVVVIDPGEATDGDATTPAT